MPLPKPQWMLCCLCGIIAFNEASTAAPAPAVTAAELERPVLRSHNALREKFGVEPLVWDTSLAAEASEYAATLAATDTFAHSTTSAGENLWSGTRGAFTLDEMVDGWSSEQREFVGGTFPYVTRTKSWEDVGHFTQMVWPTTRRVGCGLASNGAEDFLVCRYWPAGNVLGDVVRPQAHLASTRQ